MLESGLAVSTYEDSYKSCLHDMVLLRALFIAEELLLTTSMGQCSGRGLSCLVCMFFEFTNCFFMLPNFNVALNKIYFNTVKAVQPVSSFTDFWIQFF